LQTTQKSGTTSKLKFSSAYYTKLWGSKLEKKQHFIKGEKWGIKGHKQPVSKKAGFLNFLVK